MRRIRPALILMFFLIFVASGVAGASVSAQEVQVNGNSLAGDVALRQAYLGWLAAQQEAGMSAAIRFITEQNGSVESLSSVEEEFHRQAAGIQACRSMGSLDSMIGTLRETTRQFQDATREQVALHSLNESDLESAVSAAVYGDERSQALEDEYWMTRMDSEPAAFDRYVRESQETLTVLKGCGYDVASAQENLDQIETMRGEYVAALASHDFGTAEIIREKIQAASVSFEDRVRSIGASGQR